MLVGEPWERVAINITDEHPKSRNGNGYMLTVMDHFIKWAQAYSIKDHKVPTMDLILVEQLFSRLDIADQLISDHGPEFGRELFLKMCKWMLIDKIGTSSYRLACNWMLERYPRN